MLRFVSRPKMLTTGDRVNGWYVQMEIRKKGSPLGARLEFKVDTGADLTVAPLSVAPRLGLNPSDIKRNCQKISIGTASGHSLIAFVQEVEFHLDDDYFGWAERIRKDAFCDSDPAHCCAGKLGFLQFLRFADLGPYFLLDPIVNFPGRVQCSTPRQGPASPP
jgi:hypothetical protein